MPKLELKNFPEELHREMKLQAQADDRTLKSWIIRAIKEKLSKSDKRRRWEET